MELIDCQSVRPFSSFSSWHSLGRGKAQRRTPRLSWRAGAIEAERKSSRVSVGKKEAPGAIGDRASDQNPIRCSQITVRLNDVAKRRLGLTLELELAAAELRAAAENSGVVNTGEDDIIAIAT